VLPFKRFRNAREGPESSTRSSGRRGCGPPARSWGIDKDFPRAFAKSQSAAYGGMAARRHTAFVSVSDP